MKKMSVIILGLLLCLGVKAQQSFYSGALVISGNFGVDGNMTTQHYVNPPENSAQTLNGMAPASNFNMAGEVGLLNWLGLGLVARVDNYYATNNGVTNTTTTAGAFDLGGTVNIHLIRWSALDLFAGYDWGASQFMYYVHDGANTTEYSMGTWSDIHATGRIYFSKHFGINASVYVPSMTYNDIKSSNQPVDEYLVNYWHSTGYGASVGLQYKLF